MSAGSVALFIFFLFFTDSGHYFGTKWSINLVHAEIFELKRNFKLERL